MKNLQEKEYLTGGLTAAKSACLLKLVKERSCLKRVELEDLFGIGVGSAVSESGGNTPGDTIGHFLCGKRKLTAKKAHAILKISRQRGWLSSRECADYEWILYEKEFTNKYKSFERLLFRDLEKIGKKIIGKISEHPDLSLHDMFRSVDLVLSPLLKRLIIEAYLDKKTMRMESFALLMGENADIWFSGEQISPEIRFADELEKMK